MSRTRSTIAAGAGLAGLALLGACGSTSRAGVDGQEAATSVPPAATTAAGGGSPAASTTTAPSATSCVVTVSDPTPDAGGTQTVRVHTTQKASVELTEHDAGQTVTHDATAADNGVATVTFTVGSGPSGRKISVTVITDSRQTCSTTFTPR